MILIPRAASDFSKSGFCGRVQAKPKTEAEKIIRTLNAAHCREFSDKGDPVEKSKKFVKGNENAPEFKQKNVNIIQEKKKNKMEGWKFQDCRKLVSRSYYLKKMGTIRLQNDMKVGGNQGKGR